MIERNDRNSIWHDCHIYIRIQMYIHRCNCNIYNQYVNRATIYCEYYITRNITAQ